MFIWFFNCRGAQAQRMNSVFVATQVAPGVHLSMHLFIE